MKYVICSLGFLFFFTLPGNSQASLIEETAQQLLLHIGKIEADAVIKNQLLLPVAPSNKLFYHSSLISTPERVSTSTKEITVVTSKKLQSLRDKKSGVTVRVPSVPRPIISREDIGFEPAHGYVYTAEFSKNNQEALPVSLLFVSSGFIGTLGWEAIRFGVRQGLEEAIASNSFDLPTELQVNLRLKQETLRINGVLVEHHYIDYLGNKLFGMYSGSTLKQGVTIGAITVYAHEIIASDKSQSVITEAKAQEYLATVLKESVVNKKVAAKFFKITSR